MVQETRKEESQKGESGKYVGVMRILVYDSINQQCSVDRGGREESMENLPGPQDGGKAIQQNNGLLCPALPSLAQHFLATSASPATTYIVIQQKKK